MKVVLFCGGLGTRLRAYSETMPKPLVSIGGHPIIWHLMKFYAHHGHKEFLLCLGYRGEQIKQYFLNYNFKIENDFVMDHGVSDIDQRQSDIDGWRITFVDTGLDTNIGDRLRQVESYLGDDDVFLANYCDQLSNLPLGDHVDDFLATDAVASMVAVRPSQSYHAVRVSDGGAVEGIVPAQQSDVWMNGGYFVFRRTIFGYLREGDDLVERAFQRLMEAGKLRAYRYSGFWKAMDTYKDKVHFDQMVEDRETPWEVWNAGCTP